VIDLRRLADELPDGFEDLRRLIVRVLDLNSSRTDLRLAADFAHHALSIIRQPRPSASPLQEDVILALTSSAVIYYARATKSSSDHRRTFNLRCHFDTGEIERHDLLCRLRDDAIAHFGPGELPDGPQLRSDYLIVSPQGQLVAVSRNTYGTEQFAETIFQQAQRASLIMQRLFHEEEAKLIEALNGFASEPALNAAKEASTVDLAETLGNAKIAANILKRRGTGHERLHAD
jgi:hypothetical protein